MTSYTTIRDATRSHCNFWECPIDVELYPVDSSYTDPIAGDFVVVDAQGEVNRTADNPSSRPFGLTLGTLPNSEVYPAFGGHYNNRVLVGVITSNTELVLPFINAGAAAADGVGVGEYLPANKTNVPPVGTELGLAYNSTTRRWGIRVEFNGTNWASPAGTNLRVQIVRYVKGHLYNSPEATGEGDYLFALVRVL